MFLGIHFFFLLDSLTKILDLGFYYNTHNQPVDLIRLWIILGVTAYFRETTDWDHSSCDATYKAFVAPTLALLTATSVQVLVTQYYER